jgi:proteasome accessory factor C
MPASTRPGPRGTGERLSRLLVMLPWLMERGEVPLAEVADRFHLRPEQVVADLELVAMCGLPPYVDELIDVFIDDDMVYAGVPRLFTRPLRLTAPEGAAILAAGRAAMALPGADPSGSLGRALDKLAAALGVDERGLVVDEVAPDHAATVSQAVERAAALRIHYWTPSRGEVTERTIHPQRVFVRDGHWYVSAVDDLSGERRTFRIDRIEAAVLVDTTPAAAPPPPDGDPLAWFEADPADAERVVLEVPAGVLVAVERYPNVRVVEAGAERVRIELPVSSEHWLARLLVRLGPEARLVRPEHWRALGAHRAADVLARYRRGSASS